DVPGQRIVGGEAAQLNEFPWRCAMFVQDRRTKALKYYCSCSLISSTWVMTAAHCTAATTRSKLFVDVGDHDLASLTETKITVVEVESVRQHENYNRRSLNNDISLLKLKTPVQFDDKISPVCLPFNFKERTFEKENATVSGWGLMKEGSRTKPSILQKVDLPVLSPQQCRRYFGRGAITNNMLCTLMPGKDACQGDSGSSLDFLDESSGRSYAIGVVSFGRGCGRRNSPGVFARVTSMLSWIKTKTGEKFCET
ncbi:unnamed protein product, partial [Allacma fusca]